MTLTINGQTESNDAATLAELVERLGLGDAKVATALNGTFVPASGRARAKLNDGDRIEVVAPMQGG